MGRRKAATAPAEPYVETTFLYRVPYVARDRLTLKEGALELVHPPRLSTESGELALQWLDLVRSKLQRLISDELDQCSACDEPAKFWEREPELKGWCKAHRPEPFMLFSHDDTAKRY